MSNTIPSQIAVVDDDSRILESLGSLLESTGYAVSLFQSAEEFLGSEAAIGADCLITDVRMPLTDGLELVRRVKLRRNDLPVIIITAHNDQSVRKHALEEGVTCFILKPFKAATLGDAIRRALGESHQ